MNSNKRNTHVNPDEIVKTLRLIMLPGQVTEVRAFSVTLRGERYVHKTVSGYFDDPAKLAKAVGEIVLATGIYIIPNQVDPALLSRAANRLRPVKGEPTTADHDIKRRLYLLIDLDATRPAGISATDEEHKAAIAKAKAIRELFAAKQWPDPLLADSGNGGHLVYRIDLPPDDEGLVERCLHALQAMFGDDTVKVDCTVHNPARIWKLYGTTAAKGDSTPDRPHRMAIVIDAPEVLEVVPIDKLKALAAEVPPVAKAKGNPNNGKLKTNGTFDLDEWIAEHELDVCGPEDWRGGRRWVFETCPWNSDHTNGSAYIAQLAAGGISAGCHHDGCKEKGWHELRDVVEPGWRDARKDGDEKQRKSQADKLVELAHESGLVLFHSPGGDPEAYVTVPMGDHHETMRVFSKAFRMFLSRQLWVATQKAPAAQSMQDALGVLAGQALFEGDEHPVAVRIAEHGGDIYLDLANKDWQAVCISPAGWDVVANPPVRFVRPRGVLPLPVPERGGHIDELREFVNVASDADFTLLLACIVAYLRPKGPFPVLAIYGEQGSAKSTTTRIVRELTDPNLSPLRCAPREPRDLMIAAANGWIVALENLSSISDWLSDALCRLSTGGGFSTRELYSDGEEKLFDSQRPVLLNGIVEVVTRPDLGDRAVAITLPSIRKEKRMPESEFWQRFYRAWPRILGALLDLASTALRRLPETKLDCLPRMADFALWATAALGNRFLQAYAGNRDTLNEAALESCVIVPYLRKFLEHIPAEWKGTAGKLLDGLNALATDDAKHQKAWPKTPTILSGILRRVAPILRETVCNLEFDRTGQSRNITITRIVAQDSVISDTKRHCPENPETVPPSAECHDSVTNPAQASPPSAENSAETPAHDAGDADDASMRSQSGPPEEETEWTA